MSDGFPRGGETCELQTIEDDINNQFVQAVLEIRSLQSNSIFFNTAYYATPQDDPDRTAARGLEIMARHGGGAFSGKDATKVDRSAAYMARYIAKNVVAAGLADVCEVQLSYAIGKADPTSVHVDCQGTNHVDESVIRSAITQTFKLRPADIISTLDLRRPIFKGTATHGHFGRTPDECGPGTFSWEKTDRVEALQKAASLNAVNA